MEVPAAGRSQPIDIGEVLDDGPFTAFQKVVVCLGALAITIDGLDSQLIGFAIPMIAREWGIARGSFAWAVAAGLVGMGLGSACAGLIADRLGRRRALLGSILVFGAATCLVSLAGNLAAIGALRFFAGFGIGGGLPCGTTLTAEFTPRRMRTMTVTITIVCVPLGGMLAGFLAGAVLPAYGWRTLFFIGGMMAVILGIGLIFILPESPRFLARRPARWPELERLLARMARMASTDHGFIDPAEENAENREGFLALLTRERRRDTIALWAAFCCCLLAVYSAFSWLPAMLVSAGLSAGAGSAGLTAYNMGGVIGSMSCALAIARFGSRPSLLGWSAGGVGSAFLLCLFPIGQHAGASIFGLGVHGFFVSGVQSTLYALCAHVYPTAIRATGTAMALALGRLGAVLSGFLGAWTIAAGGSTAYLALLGAAMLLVLIALAIVRNHIPAPGAEQHAKFPIVARR